MTDRKLKALAKRIALDLFTSGSGAVADRLRLEGRGVGESWGAWGQDAMVSRIYSELKRTLGDKPNGGKKLED